MEPSGTDDVMEGKAEQIFCLVDTARGGSAFEQTMLMV